MATWNLEHIYSFKDTEKILKELHQKVEAFEDVRKELTPKITTQRFLAVLKELENIAILAEKLSAYAGLWQAENTADDKRNSHESKIRDILTDLGNKTMFFSLWFKDLDDKTANALIKASPAYAYYLEHKRLTKKYTLSEKEEKAINLVGSTSDAAWSTMYDIVTNRFRFPWEGKQVPLPEVIKHYSDPNPELREKAYRTVLGKYKEEEPILGEIYKTLARSWRNECIKLRNYTTPISARNVANDVPDEAINALLEVVKENAQVFRDYFVLKAKLLKQKKPARFHIYAPYESKLKEYPYEECKKICLDAYGKFSPEMQKHAKKIFDDGHVHSDMTPNKQSGAFCATVLPTISPYVLLNHVGKADDLFTMMHELGHGIHSLMASHHNIFNQHACLPLAETASIMGEQILLRELLKTATKEEKIALLAKQIDKHYASIARQAFFVLFEIEAHEKIGQGCTVEELNESYAQNLKTQFGDVVEVDEIFRNEWKYIPHIYHTPFYCYAYAFGNLLVLALYERYIEEGQKFVPQYLNLLAAGGSIPPEKVLQDLNIDIRSKKFWEKGFMVIRKEVEELKTLVNT